MNNSIAVNKISSIFVYKVKQKQSNTKQSWQ